MAFPSSIPIKSLKVCNPSYDPKKLQKYEALYSGGEKFDAIRKDMLTRREIEKANDELGDRSYKLRLERAPYVSRVGGLIDSFIAIILQNGPKLVPETTGPDAEFWEELNTNVDGHGTSFPSLCRATLRELLLTGRPYFKLSFIPASSDASISLLKAAGVCDWDFGDDGELAWVRVDAVDCVRPMIFSEEDPPQERYTWSFYSGDEIVIYEATKKVGEDWDEKAVAKKIDNTTNDFGLPIYDVKVDESLNILPRMFDVIRALFNREASLQFSLDQQAFSIPVLTSDNASSLPEMKNSQLLALRLNQGEKFEFVTPAGTGFDALDKDVERLRLALYEVVQSTALQIASVPQAGRLSASAIVAMQKPLSVLLNAFSAPLKECLQRLVDELLEYREDDFEVRLEGFDSIEVSDEQEKEVRKSLTGEEEREDGEGSEQLAGDTGSEGGDGEEGRSGKPAPRMSDAGEGSGVIEKSGR
jgi:hypothetical protein